MVSIEEKILSSDLRERSSLWLFAKWCMAIALLPLIALITLLLAGCGAYEQKDCYVYGQDCPHAKQGEPGSDGQTVIGPAGPRGEAGSAGSDGETVVGPKGDRGDVGPAGPSGESIVGPSDAVGPADNPCLSCHTLHKSKKEK